MFRNSSRWLSRSAAIFSIVVTAACNTDVAAGPRAGEVASVPVAVASASREVDLGSCTNLGAYIPEGSTVSAHLYASGTQNYFWTGTAWLFIGPSADLFADAGGQSLVGTHYSGPTWVSTSGSGVVGLVLDQCPADPNSIPWLVISAVSSRGPGIFEGTTRILRVNTTGGKKPTTPGTVFGDEVRVPYTAEYVFFR